MNILKKLFVFLIIVCVLASQFICTSAAHSIKLDSELSFAPVSNSNAYVTMTDTVKANNLTVKFGSKTSVKDAASASLEQIPLGGVITKKLYRGTDVYITLDKAKFNGSKYLVLITYYDFGPDKGDFHLEYNSSDASLSSSQRAAKRYTIRKTGMKEKWTTVSFFIDDAAFTGAMEHGADIRIVNGAYNAFAKIEIIDYSDFEVTSQGKITPLSFTDTLSGRKTEYINFNGKPAIRPYVTAQGWNYEGTKFIFGSYDTLEDGTVDTASYKIYEYDIVNHTVNCLDTDIYPNGGGLNAVVTPDNYIYYAKNDGRTWKMNWLTYEKEKTNARVYGTMNVTNDGKWISGYGGNSNEVRKSSTATGYEEAFYINNAKALWASNPISSGKGHPMINPEYPHLLFFCHEGTTDYIPDRLWLANYNTKSAYNMFLQVPYTDTITAETSGHEVWSMDGEMMYWVKYTYKNNIGQSGLMRMDKFGNNREYLNGDYKYWHCYPSADHNFVIGDTNDSPTKIVIANTNTYKATVLSSFHNENASHPNQPHPHISFNSFAASWQFMKNGVTCIGWQEIRDITAHAQSRQKIPFGNDVNIVTCKGTVSAVSDDIQNGVTYKKANSGNGIYIDILNEVCASTNADVTLEVTYLDKGTNPLNIVYTSGVEDIYDLATREDKTYSITKTGTNSQKTAVVNLGSINANNAGKFMSDFYFTSGDGAYISNVRVITEAPGQEAYNKARIYASGSQDGSDQYNGLQITSTQTASPYNSNLYHIDDVEGWQAEGITQETVDKATAEGLSYVTLNSDGAWKYEEHTDALGVTRPAFFAPANYRQAAGSYQSIKGNLYFKVLDNVITENDNKVTFTINYVDLNDFKVDYTSTDSDGISSFTVNGTNSGLWRRAIVTVNDARMSASNSGTKLANGVEDIKIASNGAQMYISEISVSKDVPQSDSGVFTGGLYYNGYGLIASKSQRVSVSADNNTADGGIITTEKANYPSYNSTLYHVDDVEGWQEAGITQDKVDDAIANGCSYITKNVDGAWKYDEVTDAAGETRKAFYAPRNFRPSASNVAINSNLYLRLTDSTITKDDRELIFKIDYLDNGTSFSVTYTSHIDGGLATFSVITSNTGKWETAYVLVADAALSVNNTQTKLATWEDDIKINGGGNDLYVSGVTVMKVADGSGVEDMEIIGGNKQTDEMKPGDVSSAVAVVANKTNSNADVFVASVVYNSDGSLKAVEKSETKTIAPGKYIELETPKMVLCIGETQRTFVWGANLKPITQENDPLGLLMIGKPDGAYELIWNNYSWPGYFFNIYCNGELVGRTTDDTYRLENVEPGSYVYTVDIADNYGRVIFRSKDINVQM